MAILPVPPKREKEKGKKKKTKRGGIGGAEEAPPLPYVVIGSNTTAAIARIMCNGCHFKKIIT